MIVPVGMALLVRSAGPGQLGRAMGIVGIAQVLGPILGPVLGGLLVENGGWRWIFYVNVPVGAIALALAARLLPANVPKPSARLDLIGFLLLAPGLAAMVYGLAETSDSRSGLGVRPIGAILAGVALVAAFAVHSRRVPNPLINVRLLQRPAFAGAAGSALLLGMALYATMFLLPLYYQTARGQSALDAGLLMAPQGVGAAIMMPLAGRATDRFGAGRVVPVGLTLLLLGTLPFAFAGPSTPYPLLVGALVVRGIGLGGSMMPAMAGAYATLGGSGVERATSGINAIQRMGGSLGVALVSVVLEHQSHGLTADSAESAGAFAATFWWPVALGVLAFVPAAFLPRRPATAAAGAMGSVSQVIAKTDGPRAEPGLR
jgi:EmrB/QacA subfamily drug resistance transporter